MAELGFKHKSSFLKPHTFPPIGCSLPKIFLDYLLYFWHLTYIHLTLKITSMGSYCYTSVTNVKTGVKRVWTIVSRLYYCYGEGKSTPVLLRGKSHGQRSLVGCSPWGREESDTTQWLHFHFSLACIGEGNGNPLQCSCLENPRDKGAWWAAVYGVAQSRTRLKRLSSSSSILLLRGLLRFQHFKAEMFLLLY